MIFSGSLFGLAARRFWGLVFVVPLMLPEYKAVVQSVARITRRALHGKKLRDRLVCVSGRLLPVTLPSNLDGLKG